MKTVRDGSGRRGLWRPRFTIRAALVLMTLLCVALVLWSLYIDPYRRQANAVQRIRDLGGTVSERTAEGPAWQRWLVETVLGPQSYSEATTIELAQPEIPEQLQSQLGKLPWVEALVLDGAGVDDRVVLALLPGEHVEYLSLRYTEVSDTALMAAARFPALKRLKVTGASVTDEGLEALAQSESLEELFIRWTDVTEEGIAEFKRRRPACQVNYHVQ